MGKVWMPGGGGGANLDVVTVTDPWDVAAGKVIVDKDGNPLTGTLTERGAWGSSVGMNGRIAIPAGRHNGGGYVDGPPVTQRGAWTSSVGMNGAVTVPEGYHNGAGKVNGPPVTQRGAWTGRIGVNGRATIPEGYHNGSGYVDQSINNRGAWATSIGVNGIAYIPEGYHNGGGYINQSIATQGWNYLTPATYNQVVCSAGRYASGDQGLYGDPNLVPGNIAKDRIIFGVRGTAAVYGMDPMYFFNNGAWSNLQTTGMINTTPSGSVLSVPYYAKVWPARLNQTVDLTAYKYLKVAARTNNSSYNRGNFAIGVSTKSEESSMSNVSIKTITEGINSEFTVGILNISALSGFYYIYVGSFYALNGSMNVTSLGEIQQIFLTAT